MRIPMDQDLDTILAECLQILRTEHHRTHQKASIGRANFLAQAKSLAQEDEARVPRLKPPRLSPGTWIGMIPQMHTRKLSPRLLVVIGSWILIFTIFFGTVSASVFASQDSLPTDPLYPIKIFGEEIHLALILDFDERTVLLLRYSRYRLDEMLEMVANQEPFPEKTALNWQEHINLALHTAAQMDDAAMMRALEHIDLALRLQEQRLRAIQAGGSIELERLRARLYHFKGDIHSGMQDPAAFRQRWQTLYPSGQIPLDDHDQITPEVTLPRSLQVKPLRVDPFQSSTDQLNQIRSRKPGDSGATSATTPDPGQLKPSCDKDCIPTIDQVGSEGEANPRPIHENETHMHGVKRENSEEVNHAGENAGRKSFGQEASDSTGRFGSGSSSP